MVVADYIVVVLVVPVACHNRRDDEPVRPQPQPYSPQPQCSWRPGGTKQEGRVVATRRGDASRAFRARRLIEARGVRDPWLTPAEARREADRLEQAESVAFGDVSLLQGGPLHMSCRAPWILFHHLTDRRQP